MLTGGSARVEAVEPESTGDFQPVAREFVEALRSAAREISDPAAKLCFVRASVDRYRVVDRAMASVPSALLRRLVLRMFGLEGLRRLVLTLEHKQRGPALRRRLWAGALAALTLLVLGLSALSPLRTAPAQGQLAPIETRLPEPRSVPAAPPPTAEALPASTPAVAAAQVWRVESGRDFEIYSNGLRIELGFASTHVPRRFKTFTRGRGLSDQAQDQPVGLLFHTSESDVWPMEESYNQNLRGSSHSLLRYIQRLHLYNYVIDRFGRVYRVVAEEHKANHAGFSVWEQQGRVYLNLNNAFLGVCFETRWEGGHGLPITQAQLNAGGLLTDYLRQRFKIPPGMCVTHGITSVNHKKHLIGHHVDWARGFPFEAFGLPDQYALPAPAVSLFGFGYDDDFVKVMGEPWPGVRAAEARLAAEAAANGQSLEALRRERGALFDEWIAIQARDEGQAAASSRGVRSAGSPVAAGMGSNKPFSANGG